MTENVMIYNIFIFPLPYVFTASAPVFCRGWWLWSYFPTVIDFCISPQFDAMVSDGW